LKYMGSKKRLAKDLLQILSPFRLNCRWYVEPFVGGGNSIELFT